MNHQDNTIHPTIVNHLQEDPQTYPDFPAESLQAEVEIGRDFDELRREKSHEGQAFEDRILVGTEAPAPVDHVKAFHASRVGRAAVIGPIDPHIKVAS